jgi:hypothetical protein
MPKESWEKKQVTRKSGVSTVEASSALYALPGHHEPQKRLFPEAKARYLDEQERLYFPVITTSEKHSPASSSWQQHMEAVFERGECVLPLSSSAVPPFQFMFVTPRARRTEDPEPFWPSIGDLATFRDRGDRSASVHHFRILQVGDSSQQGKGRRRLVNWVLVEKEARSPILPAAP